jgi:hypothetical protein
MDTCETPVGAILQVAALRWRQVCRYRGNGCHHIRYRSASSVQPRRLRARVSPVARKHARLVPDVIRGCDADPHLPIESVRQIVPEAAEPSIDIASYDRGRTLHALSLADSAEPARQHSRAPTFSVRDTLDIAAFIDECMPTEGHAYVLASAKTREQSIVESWKNHVVLMEDVHELAPRVLDRSVPVPRKAESLAMLMEFDSVCRWNVREERRNVYARGAIIEDRDLHVLGAAILREHALQRIGEEPIRLVRGYDDRYERLRSFATVSCIRRCVHIVTPFHPRRSLRGCGWRDQP